MSGSIKLTNKQTVSGGVTILDADNEPFATLADVQAAAPGFALTFVSSDPTVAAVTVRPDGLNIDIATVKNGNATLTVHVEGMTKADGSPIPDDVTNIQIVNSVPNSLNFTLGSAVDEA